MKHVFSRFTPLTLPLRGEVLIEASAGTGKTFTIGLLYLRLLLGLGGHADFIRRLSVKEILVVTFTESSTAELRARIGSNIHELRIACIRGETLNPALATLMSEISNIQQAISHLLIAERNMHHAVICTIHGFCQRILHMKAFEAGMLFTHDFLEDETSLQRRGTIDFWRRDFYSLPLPIVRIINKIWSGPDQLLQTLSPWLHREELTIKEDIHSNDTIEQRHGRIIARINMLKTAWLQIKNLQELIAKSGVNRRIYNSKNLPTWLDRITKWALSETVDYVIAQDLVRFSQNILIDNTIKGESPYHPVFDQIQIFLASQLSLRNLIISRGLKSIRAYTKKEKNTKSQIGFYDLLTFMNIALQKPSGKILATAIRQSYPVVFIDEFQDTDLQQYRIFQTLYYKKPNTALLLIGDPKQAIYSFRGASIFTYMQASSQIKQHYTLDVNQRSSKSMVNSINHLFTHHANPFIFTAIPFIPVQSAKINHDMYFSVSDRKQPALTFWLQPGNGVSLSNYQEYMAKQCAVEISNWLSLAEKNAAFIGNTKIQHPVKTSDIVVLVRNKNEAALVQQALDVLNIPSVYLSNRESVFNTLAAQEVLLLLKAMLTPEKESTFLHCLITNLFGMDATTLDIVKHDEPMWTTFIAEFMDYQNCWKKYGVLPMLRRLIKQRKIEEKLLTSKQGERYLTDLLHIGEILQARFSDFDNHTALVRWLSKKIQKKDAGIPNQRLRVESNHNIVKIITIYKSKGLQYPLVWIPFAISCLQAKHAVYYDDKICTTFLDLNQEPKSMILADRERLAEDVRLLYVALTRSIFHCSVGIAPLCLNIRQNTTKTDLHHSALGYLIQKGKAMDASGLLEALVAFDTDSTTVMISSGESGDTWHGAILKPTIQKTVSNSLLSYPLEDFWRITSYSDLYKQYSLMHLKKWQPMPAKVLDLYFSDVIESNKQVSSALLTPHTFPRGVKSGVFLHKLLETSDTHQLLNKSWLESQLVSQGFSKDWGPVMYTWMKNIVHAPLNHIGVSLSQIPLQDKRVEMQFYLPISPVMTAEKLNNMIRQDPLSASCSPLRFQQVRGMLQGCIDLVFFWHGKYYIVDYKSNWLGPDSTYYTQEIMIDVIREHRYDLQYQFYTLALHRYLRHRLLHYNYEHHFGGIIYLFLRGIEDTNYNHGIYHAALNVNFIDAMDDFFANKI
ncbi:RecBCD enzyme subunit RecB [Candidatus Erwinia haradaeae]|uniref:RecBCD enzyme subunit RecB n=1 Tax=Candidatus Erwinia haradaeae TaxID=1922217 RepID=A0A451DCU8_9GAMM|nr:exodeoxyribonuclease V subunit beta [Candidatus Erwinia haradaeae]VFP84275.1 RecBCD enzyme subunit RecB [Candidatus Erwinia haradaeae]